MIYCHGKLSTILVKVILPCKTESFYKILQSLKTFLFLSKLKQTSLKTNFILNKLYLTNIFDQNNILVFYIFLLIASSKPQKEKFPTS